MKSINDMTPAEAYLLGKKDGRAEVEEALQAAADYNMSVEDFLNK